MGIFSFLSEKWSGLDFVRLLLCAAAFYKAAVQQNYFFGEPAICETVFASRVN